MKQLLRTGLFLFLAVFFAWTLLSGRFRDLVHPRMALWIAIAAIVLVFISVMEFRDRGRKKQGEASTFYVLPIAIAFILVYLATPYMARSAAPLNLSSPRIALVQQGSLLSVQIGTSDASPPPFTMPPKESDAQLEAIKAASDAREQAWKEASEGNLSETIVFDDAHYWALFNRLYERPQEARGKSVVVEGFVARSPDIPQDMIVIARRLMWCCAADISVIGFPARGESLAAFNEGDWVQAEGRLRVQALSAAGEGEKAPTPVIELSSIRRVEKRSSEIIYPY